QGPVDPLPRAVAGEFERLFLEQDECRALEDLRKKMSRILVIGHGLCQGLDLADVLFDGLDLFGRGAREDLNEKPSGSRDLSPLHLARQSDGRGNLLALDPIESQILGQVAGQKRNRTDIRLLTLA